MKNFLSVSRAAKAVGMTAETLRHYDRIGLVRPSMVDKWTGYRCYSADDIVKLNTISVLKSIDMPLFEIKKILEYDDLSAVVEALLRTNDSVDAKIRELTSVKEKIKRAVHHYESVSGRRKANNQIFETEYAKRVVLLSDTLCVPSLDSLWDYHSHFNAQIGECLQSSFEFEDAAGIYIADGSKRLFAICEKYVGTDGIKILPQGKYLCADCTEDELNLVTEKLTEAVRTKTGRRPDFAVQMIVLTGILKWDYQVQVPLYLTQ